MTLAPRFSATQSKARFVGRQRSKLAKIADPLPKRYSTNLILVAQADSFTLRTRWLKFRRICNVKHSRPSSTPLLNPSSRVRVTVQSMSGTRRSTLGSQSPRPRYQSTSSRDGSTPEPSLTGRERLAIRFLAGEQTRPRTSSISAGNPSGLPPDFVRQRVASTHVPGANSSRHGQRSFTPVPSGLGQGAVSASAAIHASPPDTRGRTYHLEVEQHPERTAEFGPAVLSRLPLAPAPIVKLTIRDHTGSPIDPNTELPYLIAHLSLCTESGHPLQSVPGAPSQQHLLYGTLVSSAQVLRNLRGRVAPYFIFPDVSVRQRGRYSLKISLVRLPGIGGTASASSGTRGDMLASVYTQVFEVVPQTNYAAPPPTPLTQLFIRQGARMTYGA